MSLWKQMRVPQVASLVSTRGSGDDAPVNASPKSWWSPVSYEPPLLMLSVKPQSDTDRNIRETGLFVLHVPPQSMAKEVLHTAKPLPYGENELDDQKLPWEWLENDQLYMKMPYLPEVPWMCCWVTDVLEAREGVNDHDLFVAQVGLAGGFDPEFGVGDVLLHGMRNVFIEVGGAYAVEPY